MNKTIYYIIIIGLVLGSYFYINSKYGIDEDFFKEMLTEETVQGYKGIIVKKYTEESGRHPINVLELKDGTIANPIGKVWKQTAVGDSIVKIKDKDYVTIYKANDSVITFSYKKWIDDIMKEELK